MRIQVHPSGLSVVAKARGRDSIKKEFIYLLVAAVVAELVESLLDLLDGVVGGSVLEGGTGSVDPLEQVGGQLLVLVHKTLILLVDAQDFEDAVGGGLGLNFGLLLCLYEK